MQQTNFYHWSKIILPFSSSFTTIHTMEKTPAKILHRLNISRNLWIIIYCCLQYAENKSFCEDLTEGKFSFPIIHAIRSQDGDKQVLRILLQVIYSIIYSWLPNNKLTKWPPLPKTHNPCLMWWFSPKNHAREIKLSEVKKISKMQYFDKPCFCHCTSRN